MIREVEIPDGVRKRIRKLLRHVVMKFLGWAKAVRRRGLEEVRRSPGFHDEPVKGSAGQRSIRLSRAYRAYRAYYRVLARYDGIATVELVRVEGVDKHEYGK